MTHLSEFGYLDRAVSNSLLLPWIIYWIWKRDKFKSVSHRKLRKFQLKSVLTITIITAQILQLLYDYIGTYFKYKEGTIFLSQLGPDGNPIGVVQKPFQLYSESSKILVFPTDIILTMALSLQTGSLFLLQACWNYLGRKVTNRNFSSSLEMKLCITWTLVVFIVTPALQIFFGWYERSILKSDENVLPVVCPQLFYCFQLFVFVVLTFETRHRFRDLRNQSVGASNSATIRDRLDYFMEMNTFLACSCFVSALALTIVNGDALTASKSINKSKFKSDLCIKICNAGVNVIWICLVLILYPRGYSGSSQLSAPRSFNTQASKVSKGSRVDAVIPFSSSHDDMQKRTKRTSKELDGVLPNARCVVIALEKETDDCPSSIQRSIAVSICCSLSTIKSTCTNHDKENAPQSGYDDGHHEGHALVLDHSNDYPKQAESLPAERPRPSKPILFSPSLSNCDIDSTQNDKRCSIPLLNRISFPSDNEDHIRIEPTNSTLPLRGIVPPSIQYDQTLVSTTDSDDPPHPNYERPRVTHCLGDFHAERVQK